MLTIDCNVVQIDDDVELSVRSDDWPSALVEQDEEPVTKEVARVVDVGHMVMTEGVSLWPPGEMQDVEAVLPVGHRVISDDRLGLGDV